MKLKKPCLKLFSKICLQFVSVLILVAMSLCVCERCTAQKAGKYSPADLKHSIQLENYDSAFSKMESILKMELKNRSDSAKCEFELKPLLDKIGRLAMYRKFVDRTAYGYNFRIDKLKETNRYHETYSTRTAKRDLEIKNLNLLFDLIKSHILKWESLKKENKMLEYILNRPTCGGFPLPQK